MIFVPCPHPFMSIHLPSLPLPHQPRELRLRFNHLSHFVSAGSHHFHFHRDTQSKATPPQSCNDECIIRRRHGPCLCEFRHTRYSFLRIYNLLHQERQASSTRDQDRRRSICTMRTISVHIGNLYVRRCHQLYLILFPTIAWAT